MLDAANRPISGAALTLVAGGDPAGKPRTHADGRFATSVRIRAAGTLRVTYLPFSDSGRPLRSRALRVTMRRGGRAARPVHSRAPRAVRR